MGRKKRTFTAIERQKIAKYYVERDSTIRKTAIYFGIPKSHVHIALDDFRTAPSTAGSELALKVEAQINKNIAERAKRGGNATKEKYLKKKK